jgi:hypothetical protein
MIFFAIFAVVVGGQTYDTDHQLENPACGNTNPPCSGHGDCVGLDGCFCDFGFSGNQCEQVAVIQVKYALRVTVLTMFAF